MLQHRFWNLLAKKLAKEATAEDIQELERLMRLHPEWHYAAQHIEDIWSLSLKENSQAAEDCYLRHLNRMRKIGIAPADPEDDETDLISHYPPRNKKRVLLFSIIGLVVLATVLFYSPGKKKTELATRSEVSTRMGSRSKLMLPDGSTVWLNAGSKLVYQKDFGSATREVTLVGEGYFEVTRINDLPFIIQTPTMQIRVLGTSFNVKSYLNESSSETSVIKGSVEVVPKQRPGEKFVLSTNEKLVLSHSEKNENKVQQSNTPMIVLKTITYAERDSAVVETSWVENKLVFDGEPFSAVALKMERWYAVKIIFNDKELEQMHLTGSFVSENIQQALNALQLTSNFKYEINQNIITITK